MPIIPGDVQREAKHHFELYHALRNRIDENEPFEVGDYSLDRVEPEENTETGFADLVLYDGLDPVLVVECKKLVKTRAVEQFEPHSRTVIKQASRYADDIGAEFIATYNGETFVLLRAYERSRSLYERRRITYHQSDFSGPGEMVFSAIGDMAAISDGAEHVWDERLDALVERLRQLHSFIYPRLRKSLESLLKNNDDFASEVAEWANEQGLDYKTSWIGDDSLKRTYRRKRDDVHNRFAREDAYILINQLLFYKIIQDTDRFSVYSLEAAYDAADEDDKVLSIEKRRDAELDYLQQYLRSRFDRIVEDVDYKAVFEQDDVFGTVGYDDRVADTINDFIGELDEYDLSNAGRDFLGEVYEGLIPEDERKALGEFYTPPEIAELIVKAVMDDEDDVVLDPAVGTGTFPIEVYRWLEGHGRKNHQEIVDQIAGVDVNRFAAHLAVLNLARQDLNAKTERTNIRIKDFFQLDRDQTLLSDEQADLDDEDGGFDMDTAYTFADVNVVVGNPPYINRNQIPDKDVKRSHLPSKYERTGTDTYISKKSDIYQYFFTKSLEWLDDGGRLGFITSYKWTTIKSGTGLMQYFLNNTRIKGIIGFNKAVFEDALVNTYVTLLEKQGEDGEDNQHIRDDNRVPFVRVEERMPADEILDLLDSDVSHEGDGYRVILRKQSTLRDDERWNHKWNRFIVSPTEYFELFDHEKVTTIPEVCDMDQSTGTKTQADDFFVIDEDKKAEWGIPDKYLTPAIISKTQIDEEEFLFEASDTDQYFLDLHDVTLEVIEDVRNSPIVDGNEVLQPSNIEDTLEKKLKERFRDEGHPGLAKYVEYAHENLVDLDDPHANIYGRGETWWDLGELKRPKMLMTETRQYRPGVIWSPDRLPVKDVVRPFYPKRRKDEKVLAGILNSSFGRIMIESHGRMSGGRAIRMMVYDLETLPVIDPRKISDAVRSRIEDALDDWLDAPEGDEENEELDRAVLSAIDMEDRWEEVRDVAERMMHIRNQSGEVQSLVGEKDEEVDISDIVSEEAQATTRLSDFATED